MLRCPFNNLPCENVGNIGCSFRGSMNIRCSLLPEEKKNTMENMNGERFNEQYFASLVGVWCKIELIGDREKKFIHAFPSNVENVTLNILEGEYRPGLFTCWMAYVYQDRIKISPLSWH